MLQTQLTQASSPEWDELLKPFSTYVDDSQEVIKEVLSKELDIENLSEVNSTEDVQSEDNEIE